MRYFYIDGRTKELVQKRPKLPDSALFVTVREHDECYRITVRERAREMIRVIIEKPFSEEQLVIRVRELLEEYS